jgi:hypothetical protein
MKNSEKNSSLVLYLLLSLSVLIRFFSTSPYFFISMDEGKYLKLAENIPRYVLFNNNIYISHPPLYPFIIKLFGSIMPDYLAGILISQLSTIGFILTGVFLLRYLKTEYSILHTTVAFLSLSHLLYYWSGMIYKETFFTFLIYFFISSFIFSLSEYRKVFTIIASVTGLFIGLTSDLVVFLFPVIVVIIFLFGRDCLNGKKYKILLTPVFFILAGYFIWLLGRWWIYTGNIYYPAGVDGLVERVADYRFIHLFTPRSFQWTKELTHAGISLNPAHYIKYAGAFFNLIHPFHISSADITKKDIVIFLILYMPLIFLLFSGVLHSLKKKDRTGYLMLAISFSFLAPAVFEISDPRFSIPVLLPAAYFIGIGLTKIKVSAKALSFSLFLFLTGFVFFWISTHPHFFGFSRRVTELQKTAEFINRLPGDGIMAQFGYPPEIAYLTNKRVICLPLNTEEFEKQIVSYDIDYLVFGVVECNGKLMENSYGAGVVNHIKSDTERFTEMKRVQEKYPSVRWKEMVYVYEIKK